MRSAPANFSLSVLRPVITGIAMYSSAKVAVDLEHLQRLLLGLLLGGVAGVALLPEELGGAQEQRVRISQRTTLAHWLMSSGRSR